MTRTEALAKGHACSNCGEPMVTHCAKHVIPCCPSYRQHQAAALDVELLARALEKCDGAGMAWCRNDFTAGEFAAAILAIEAEAAALDVERESSLAGKPDTRPASGPIHPVLDDTGSRTLNVDRFDRAYWAHRLGSGSPHGRPVRGICTMACWPAIAAAYAASEEGQRG